jgi:hypothetical protein
MAKASGFYTSILVQVRIPSCWALPARLTFMHTGECYLKLYVSHALSEITVMLLLKGLIYLETAKHDSVLKVLCHPNYTTFGGTMKQLSTGLATQGRPIPMPQGRGLSDRVKE